MKTLDVMLLETMDIKLVDMSWKVAAVNRESGIGRGHK